MGTQQILMIILSVIVVGAAVAVGIQMFNTHSYNQEKMAIQSEMIQWAVMAQAWYRTPQIMGGGSGITALTQDNANSIAQYVDRYNYRGYGIVQNDRGNWSFGIHGGSQSSRQLTLEIRLRDANDKQFEGIRVYIDLANGKNIYLAEDGFNTGGLPW